MKYNKQNNSRVRAILSAVAICTVALGGIAVGQFGTQTAMAGDNKVVSGHACLPHSNGTQTDITNILYLRSLVNQWYKCPVVRDDPNGALDFVRVRTYNAGSTSVRPQCRVGSVSPQGGAADFSPFRTTPATVGPHTLEFPLNSFTEYDNGHYVIECYLGQNDRIFSYRTHED